jgi:hypothetical protein
MHDIAQKHIFFFKLPELDPNPDLVMKFPDPAKKSGSDRIRIRNTGKKESHNIIFERKLRNMCTFTVNFV